MSNSPAQMLLTFPRPAKRKPVEKFVLPGQKASEPSQQAPRLDWDELERMAREDEAKPKMEFMCVGTPNPDYDPNYIPPDDGVPF